MTRDELVGWLSGTCALGTAVLTTSGTSELACEGLHYRTSSESSSGTSIASLRPGYVPETASRRSSAIETS
jgi:hypothetical protein